MQCSPDRRSSMLLRRRRSAVAATLLAALWLLPSLALGDDPENCLLCHQFRGLSRYDRSADRVHLFTVDPNYIHRLEGPHARLACTACHPRDEVAEIPHRPVSPVNCLQTCHLSTSDEVDRQFSHQNIALMLAASAHQPDKLAAAKLLGGPLLQKDQSTCLYCHDEPVFRTLDWAGQITGTLSDRLDRCDVCHLTQVPADVAYYVRHVGARLQPARPPLEQAQICAVCHADAEFLHNTGLHNAVASYVGSFHGKAALLGDEHTAECVDCHVSRGANVHQMLGQADPRSAVHVDNAAQSCRSPQCHPRADVALSAAGVHLNLWGQRATLEYGVALAFIILTIFSFGPSLVICLLELFQIVIGRHHERGPALHHLVENILRQPGGRQRLKRFTINQRVQHWILALLFVTLVLTGFPMKFASAGWAQTLIQFFGGLRIARHIHHWAGITLVVGFAAHGVYALVTMLHKARQRQPDGTPVGLFRAAWNLPMLIRPDDLAKGGLYMMYLLGLRKHPPTFGRFTIKEKFEYLGVFWGTTLLGITGALLWGEQFFSHYIPGRALNIALIAHTYEAFLAMIHVGILHIVNVIFQPHVFPLSPATITGNTPSDELAEQHSDFVEDAARDLNVQLNTGGAHA